jgi:type I restriction enzyme, S subunit
MAIRTFRSDVSKLNEELRFSVKHSYYSIQLKDILSKATFFPLKSILKSQPQYGSNSAGRDFEEDEYRYIRITDIDQYGNLLEDEIKSTDIDNEARYELKDNDFLFARSGNTVGKSFLYNSAKHGKALYAGYFIRFEIDFTNIEPKFFLYYTKSKIFDTWKNSIIRVMGQPNINAEEYKLLPIPEIDKKVQLNIIKKIAPIEAKIEKLKGQITEPLEIINKHFAKEFKYSSTLWSEFGKGMTAGTQKSNIKSLSTFPTPLGQIHRSNIIRFSSRYHNPFTQQLSDILRNLPHRKVSSVIKCIKKGVQPKYDPHGGLRVIKIANMKNGYLDFSEAEFTTAEFYEKNKEQAGVELDDILICCTGKVSLGKIDIYEEEEPAMLSVDSYIIKVDERKVDRLFFVYFFRSILGTFQIERDFTGTTNQIHLYDNQILEFEMPDLQLSEQRKIVDAIKKELDPQKEIQKQIDDKQFEIAEMIEAAIKTK